MYILGLTPKLRLRLPACGLAIEEKHQETRPDPQNTCIERTLDVSFIGGAYAKRPYYVFNLLENGIDVHAYGPGWRKTERLANLRRIKKELIRTREVARSIFTFSPQIRAEISSRVADMDFKDNLLAKYICNLHFPITDDEMVKKYNESKISLGFLEVYDNHDHSQRTMQHLHLREFEAPMCGALYFTNYSDELSEHYVPDKEVIIIMDPENRTVC